jgi:hypothetical protein
MFPSLACLFAKTRRRVHKQRADIFFEGMTMAPPFISALTAGILILLQPVLMFGVILARRRNHQSIGDGGQQDLLLAIRRHGNFAEKRRHIFGRFRPARAL